jgi:hypothetical protein
MADYHQPHRHDPVNPVLSWVTTGVILAFLAVAIIFADSRGLVWN